MRRDEVTAIFHERFGGEPEIWARAPGRVDLMGSHTDYNLGFVLTLAISRDTWIAARPSGDMCVRLFAANLESAASFNLDEVRERPAASRRRSWSDYVAGVGWVLQEAGYPLTGFDGVVDSTVPIGSGLSSSAALECAAAVVFREICGWTVEAEAMARLCQRAENEYVGVKCGILDQYSSCLGRRGCALMLDCRDLTTKPALMADGIQVVICDTKSRRELAGGEYGLRRAQCEEGAARMGVKALRDADLAQVEAAGLSGEVRKRCEFIVGENERVVRLTEALSAGDRGKIGELCSASFAGARDLFEIVSPSMLAMMDAMVAAPGVIGARQAGAGFGGCMVAFVESDRTEAFARPVTEAYRSRTGIQPEIYVVEADEGAGILHAA